MEEYFFRSKVISGPESADYLAEVQHQQSQEDIAWRHVLQVMKYLFNICFCD